MRKLHKAVVMVAALGSISFLGAGTALADGPVYGESAAQPVYTPQPAYAAQPAYAPQPAYGQSAYGPQDHGFGHREIEQNRRADVVQNTQCRSHDLNVDLLGEVGLLNGLAGNALNGEGHSGGQATRLGSSAGCNNQAGGR